MDVLLLDIIMPQLNGYAVLEQLQQSPAEERPRVIALTALSREDFILRAMRLDVDCYMVKPADMQAIASRIRGCMRRVATPEDKPTNGEFIVLIADKLSLEEQQRTAL